MTRKSNLLKSDTAYFIKKVFVLSVFLVLVTVLSSDSDFSLLTDQPIYQETQSEENSVKGASSFDDNVTVVRVIDGDTIVLETNEVVRYIGIDSPEIKGDDNCYSAQAKQKNEELVLGKKIILEKDISETDRYGRLLRYVYIIDEKGDEIFVNEYMVREGYAKVATYPPDVKYQQRFLQAEREAFELQKGLWSSCY